MGYLLYFRRCGGDVDFDLGRITVRHTRVDARQQTLKLLPPRLLLGVQTFGKQAFCQKVGGQAITFGFSIQQIKDRLGNPDGS